MRWRVWAIYACLLSTVAAAFRLTASAKATASLAEALRAKAEAGHYVRQAYGKLARPSVSAGAGAGLVSHAAPATPPGQLTCMLRAQL